MFLTTEGEVQRTPAMVARVIEAVARAHWRTVKAALAREGKKALTVRRTSREALRTSNARNGTGGA